MSVCLNLEISVTLTLTVAKWFFSLTQNETLENLMDGFLFDFKTNHSLSVDFSETTLQE